MPKRLSKVQRFAILNIINGVNDESIRSQTDLPENMPAWFLDWPLRSAGENMPGYMPDSPCCLFLTERSARGYCRELERQPGGRDYVSDFMPTSLREIL
jgi:hypothetical protein